MITGLGGGIVRDILLGALPPATFADWRCLMVAAAGLSLFAVTGAGKALELGVGPMQAIILGTVTAVGGGTTRDVLSRQVPSVLSSGMDAIPALVGAGLAVAATSSGVDDVLGAPLLLGAAAVCFAIRLAGLHFGLDAPKPPGAGDHAAHDGQE